MGGLRTEGAFDQLIAKGVVTRADLAMQLNIYQVQNTIHYNEIIETLTSALPQI